MVATRVRLVIALVSLPVVPSGCGHSMTPERSGSQMRLDLPDDLARLLPDGVIECHHESDENPEPYALWIFRDPEGHLLDFPSELPGFERHELPGAVLARLLESKVPRLRPGPPRGGACRYSHWTTGDTEYQVREFVTDGGWFASVELFRR